LHIADGQVAIFPQVSSNGLSFVCGLAGGFKFVLRQQNVCESLENITSATLVASLIYDLQGLVVSLLSGLEFT